MENAIYQIRDDAPGDSYRFMNMDFVNGHGIAVKGSDYAVGQEEIQKAQEMVQEETQKQMQERRP